MPRNLPSSDIRDMKPRIKRQEVEHFRMDPSTEKIDCLVKYRVMKDIGLSFGIVFSSVMAA